MIVCVCNALRERDVRTKAREVPGSIGRVFAGLGATPQCCQCIPFAVDVVRDERRRAA